jgi:hypothetical protein
MTENQRRRKEAIERYYLNPNICLHCGRVIKIKEKEKAAIVREKKFCDRSCAAQYNNRKFPKKTAPSEATCERCGKQVTLKRQKTGGYYFRKYCDACLKTVRVEQSTARVWHNLEPIPFEEQTKADVRIRNHNTRLWWGNRINSHARKEYAKSGKPYICQCGYTLHVEVCHVKDIKEFPDTALVKEINHIDNLVTLCRNCHWEFDHGHISLN